MTIVDEVFAKAIAIEKRWRYRSDLRYQWRIGHAAFDALVEAVHPESALASWGDLSFEMALRVAKANAQREADIRRAKDGWGKDGNILVGWPIVCDDKMVGFEPEVVLRETVAP